MIKISKLTIWNYCVGIIFLLASGSIILCAKYSSAFAFILLFVVAVLNCIIQPEKIYLLKKSSSLFYCVFTLFWVIIGSSFFWNNYEDNSTLGYITSMLSNYMIISSYGFYSFRKVLTNLIYMICLIGIPVFILTEFDMLPLVNVTMRNGGSNDMFFIYNIGWPYHFHRFAGIWHEPGACQIFLNVILWLHIKEISNWNFEKGQLRKLVVIFIALLLTKSTGGYFVLILLLLTCVLSLKIKSRNAHFIKIIAILITILMAFCIYNSDVVQKKIFNNDRTEIGSKDIRTNENQSMLEMTLKYPITGKGLGTFDQQRQFAHDDNTGQSNGILFMSSAWGVTWLIIFFITLFNSIKHLRLRRIQYYAIILAYILLMCNERYLEFGISFLFLFQFKNYLSWNNLE